MERKNEERNHYTMRRAQIDDLTELQKLFVDTIKTTCASDYNRQQTKAWASSIDDKQRWNEIMTNQFVLVAQQADKIVGFATLDKGNYIDMLYVHKDYQRQGIAQILFREIEAEARRLKQKTLASDVSKTARPFFENNNFKVLREQIINRNGVRLVNYKMTKILD